MGSAMQTVWLGGRARPLARPEGRDLPPLWPRGPDRPATVALTRTSAAGVVVLLVLAVAVELPAAHRRLLRVGRRVDEQVAVVGVLARDLLQVLPRVEERFEQRCHLAPGSDGFALDHVALRVQVRLLPGDLAQLRLLRAPDQAEPHAGRIQDHHYDSEREDDGKDAVHRRVGDDLLHVRLVRGVAVELVVVGCFDSRAPLGEEADQRVGGEDLVPARRERNGGVPRERQRRHPRVPQLAHLDQYGRPHGERDGGQKLVGYPEKREERVDAALRVVDARVEKVAPGRDYDGARDDVARKPGGTGEGSPHVAHEVLDHEPPDARPGIDGGQYEQRLEHDGEVVQESLHPRPEEGRDLGEDRGHPHRERRRAAGAPDDGILTDGVGGLLQRLRADREPEALDGLGGRLHGVAEDGGRSVHREVDAGVEGGRGYHRHDGHERLHEHRPVADHAHLRLFLDELGRRSRGYERVEPGKGSTSDSDEHEGEERSGEDRALAAIGELRDPRHLHHGQSDRYAHGQEQYRPDLHEGREVVARGQKDPHREYRGYKAVGYEGEGDLVPAKGPRLGVGGRLGDPTTPDDRQDQERYPDGGDLEHPPGPQEPQIYTHEDGDRDGHRDGERPPRRLGEREHHDERQDGEQYDHDGEDRDESRRPSDRPDLLSGHLPQALAVAPHGEEERGHVLNRAGQYYADDDPDGPRQEPHLCRQDRPDERPGPRYGREVVPEEHPPIHGLEVPAVVEPFSRRGPRVIRLEHLVLDKASVEPVADGVGGYCRKQHPPGVDGLAPGQRQHTPTYGPHDGDEHPHAVPNETVPHLDPPKLPQDSPRSLE